MEKSTRDHIIVDITCEELNIPIEVFLSNNRKPRYVEARWIASRLIQKIYPKISHSEIEWIIRGKDYQGWVNYSNRRFEEMIEIYDEFAAKYQKVKRRILKEKKQELINRLDYGIGDEAYFYDDYKSLPIKGKLIDFNFDKNQWIIEAIHNGRVYFKSDYELFN